jgi:hypothetical protein
LNVEFHQSLTSHFQQERLANFLIRDVDALHDLADLERLLAERAQDFLSIIQHAYTQPLILSDCFCSRAPLTQVKDIFAVSRSSTRKSNFGEGIMAQTTMAYLEQRYATLEKEIAKASRQGPSNDLAVADLQYRKLIIADEIQHNRRLVERFAAPN